MPKLFSKRCVYFSPRWWSTVSTSPHSDQMRTSLNPKPFFPPTIFFCVLS